MSRSSCISTPKNEKMMLVHRWMVDICKDEKGKTNHCAAALIGFFKYWHEIKLEISKKNKQANDIAEAHADQRTQDESLYQFHTTDELIEGVLGFFSKNTIRAAIDFLESLGVIGTYTNPNPKYKFDKTTFFLFHPEQCQQLIEKYRKTKIELSESQIWDIDLPNLGDRYPKFDPPSPKFAPEITETTTEITNKAAAANNLSQELECGNNGEPIKAAAAIFEEKNISGQETQANTFGDNEAVCKKHPVILHADDYLIRLELSDNQTDRIAEQVGELCKKLTGSGLDKSQLREQYFDGKDFTTVCGILGSVILDKTKFTRCKSHFPKKLSAILGEIERGNFCSLVADVEKQHSFSDAQAPMSKPIEPSEAQVLQRRIASIKCELNSHMQSLKTPIAQDINFAQATNERIAKLQTELEQQRNLLEDLQSVDHQARAFHEDPEPEKQDVLYGFSFQNLMQCQKL